MARRVGILVSGLAIAGIVGVTSPAGAWWQYAKWGMNAQQLIASSKGQVKPFEAANCAMARNGAPPASYQANVVVEGIPGTANFAFDGQGKLTRTTLCFADKDPNAYRLNNALVNSYGGPVAVDRSSFPSSTWRDASKGTSIKMQVFSPTWIEIVYTPTGVSGL